MKKISKILKQALRKSAEEFIYEGSWCDKQAKGLLDYNANPNQPSIITEQTNCNPYQSRTPNDWSSAAPNDACAAEGIAVRCSSIPVGYTGTLADLANGPAAEAYNNKIKLFPPNVPMQNGFPSGNCVGGWTAVPGDYMLSHPGGTQGGAWIPWLIVDVYGFTNICQGPRIGHYECAWSPAGCQDNTALNYSPSYGDDCTEDASYPANCIGGTTGADCCCEYPPPPPPIPGCMDPNATTNYDPNATVDDGSCEYEGCTDPLALNYSFAGSTPPVTATNDPYSPNPPNTGIAIDDSSCISLTFDCQDGYCEENIAGTGNHASLNDCIASEECDRWKCTKVITQDDAQMAEQLDPDLKPSKDKPEPTTTSSESTSCIKCDDGDYDLTTGWSTECQFREEEKCKEKCKIKCQCCVKNQPTSMVTQVPYDPGCLVLNGINGASECEEFTVNGIHPQYCKDVEPCYEFDNSDPYWNQCCEMCQQTSTGTLMAGAPAHCEGKCHCCGDCQGVITSHGGVSFCEDCFQYNNTPNNDPFGTGVPDPDCVCCDQYNYQGYNPGASCPWGSITYNNFNFAMGGSINASNDWWGVCYGCLMSTGALPPDPVFSSYFSYQPSTAAGALGNCECCADQEIPSWGFIPNWEEEFAGGPLDPSPLVAPSSTDDLGGVDLDKIFQTDDEYSNPEDEYKDEYEVEDEFDLDNALSTLQEGVQLKGKLLNKLRMTKLAGIKKWDR